MSGSVVVLSGGMDSATLLGKCVDEESDPVFGLSVDYGQRHSRELECAEELCRYYNVSFTCVDLKGLTSVMKGSSQTDNVDVPEGHYEEPSMKLTVVPNRNMILIAAATAHAISVGADRVVYGAHAGDHAVYPDCRMEFVTQLAKAMELCHYTRIHLAAPFVEMDKGDIAKLGLELGVPYELTWTCYKGGIAHCGKCGACTERLEAFSKAGADDPVRYAA